MMKALRYSLLSVLLALSFGCSKDEPEGQGAGDGAAALKFIPADTPYVVATLEPMPQDIYQSLEPRMDKILKAYAGVMRSVVAEKLAEEGEGVQKTPEEKAKVQALVDEFASILSVDGLKKMGFELNTTGVFYGQGLLPVGRVRLADPAAMEAGIARLEEKAGQKMSVAEIDGQSYRYAGDEEGRILLALAGNELIISVVPTQASEETIKAVLGLTKPATSLADTGELTQLAKAEGYLLNSVGLVDIRRIVDTFLEDQAGANKDLLAAMEYDNSQLSAVCRTEIKGIANVMPRMNFGYTRMDKSQFDAKMLMEFRSDLAEGMKKLAAPVPGMGGGDMGGMFGFGLSFDLLAAREFISARVAAMEAKPFECEHLADLQQSATAAKQALNQPFPPIVYSIKGFSMVLEDVEGFDMTTKAPPTGADVRGLLAVDNAQGLLAMGQMFSPELANLNLQPNGEVVELGSGIVPGVSESIFLAMTDTAIAFSMGEGLEAQLPGMLSAGSPDQPPLMSMSYDAAAYMDLIGEAMKSGGGTQQNSPAMVESMSAVMDAAGGMMDRITMDIVLTERGIEIPYTMTLP